MYLCSSTFDVVTCALIHEIHWHNTKYRVMSWLWPIVCDSLYTFKHVKQRIISSDHRIPVSTIMDTSQEGRQQTL